MTVGVTLTAIPSILIRQMKSRVPTKIHGILMSLACVCMGFAWYVIHDIKNTKNKPHLASYHGLIGAGVVVVLVLMTLISIPLFEPDWRLRTESAEKLRAKLKQPHKWAGRIWLVLAVGVLISGFAKKTDVAVVWGWGACMVPVLAITLRTSFKQFRTPKHI